jgi:hypothetical protein
VLVKQVLRGPTRSMALDVASVLGWMWAGIMLVLSIAAAIPAAAAGGAGAGAQMALPAALAVASAFGAHGVRRRQWPWIALGASAAWIAFLVLVPLRIIMMPGIGLNVAILGLVLTNLRKFR